MPASPAHTTDLPISSERRVHLRQKVGSTLYIDLDESNGGILLNVSEGGFSVQAAIPLVDDRLPRLRFRFSTSDNWILGSGRIAWTNESKKLAGVAFVDIPDEARSRIREWIQHPGGGPQVAAESKSPAKSLNAVVAADPAPKTQHFDLLRDQNPDRLVIETHKKNDCEISIPTPAAEGTNRPAAEAPEKRRTSEVSSSVLKELLVDERDRIRLHDLVSEEAERYCRRLIESEPRCDGPVTAGEFLRRLHRYEHLTESLLSIIRTGCFWGEKSHEHVWAELLERVANAATSRDGVDQWIALQYYPALLLLYTGAITAIAGDKYSTLAQLLLKPRLKGGGDRRLLLQLTASLVIADQSLANLLVEDQPTAAPVSEYLCNFLREPLREYIPSDAQYFDVFNRLEYLLALVWADESAMSVSLGWLPLGRFASENRSFGSTRREDPVVRVASEISAQGKDWPPLRAGLFSGSMERLLSARRRVAAFVASQSRSF